MNQKQLKFREVGTAHQNFRVADLCRWRTAPTLQRILIGGSLISSLLIGGITPPAPALPDRLRRLEENRPIRPFAACPDRLEDLMPLLLRDLPSYANRVNQRAYSLDRDANTPGYMILAGAPDYRPLTLAAGEKLPASDHPPDHTPQVFFTTLERQYVGGQLVRLQHDHWLFLTLTETRGWRLVLLFSAIGTPAQDSSSTPQPPSPPTDQSQGVIAQAIHLWLRDCQSGSIGT